MVHFPNQISPFRGYSISKRILKTLHHSHHPVLVLLENLEDYDILCIYIYRGGAIVDKFVMRVIQRLIRFNTTAFSVNENDHNNRNEL